jgi:hypothetical protein
MKRKNLLFVLFMLIGMSAFSQTVTLSTLSSVSPGPVQVSMTLTGFSPNVGGFQCTVRFDSTKMTFTNATDWFSGAGGTQTSLCYGANTGTVTFIDGYVPALAVNGLFVHLNFNYIGPGCTNLTFDDSPTEQLMFDENYNIYTVSWVNGQVCGVPTGIDDNTNNTPSVDIYPTIAKENVNIKYRIPETGKITFGIYNMLGDEVQKVSKECIGNLESTQEMNVSDLNSGIYFVKYQIETPNINTVKTEKITVTR